jgi:hypothetical protein
MINNKDILYIKQGNRETIIYTIKKELIVTENINKIFDKWCLESLTTYKGRMEAIKRKYHLKKLVPIYINKDLMLFPINNKKSVDNIYINVINVLNICDMKDKSKIIFKNQEYLIVNKKYQIINNYYLRCLNIYDLI